MANLLIVNAIYAGATLRRICARSGECDCRSAGETGADVDLDLVDQPLIQRLSENVAAALDQDTRYSVRSQLAEQIAQGNVAINGREFREAIDKNARRTRYLPRTRNDDASRLFRSWFSTNRQPRIV